MRIAAGTLLIAFGIFLSSIESIVSHPMKLADLFPGYSGVMPSMERLGFQQFEQFRNFNMFGDQPIGYHKYTFVRRANIIFGYIKGRAIKNAYYLFGRANVFIVFDTNTQEWILVPRHLSERLGANRVLAFVIARDEVAATHSLRSTIPAYKQAHLRACKEANDRADVVEEQQRGVMHIAPGISFENHIIAIKEEYSRTYTHAFSRFLVQHGEYNVDGNRKRRT